MAHTSSPGAARGFTLIEAMMSAAMVGLLGAGALSLVAAVDRDAAKQRQTAQAVSVAQETFDLMYNIAGAAASHGGATRMCEAMEAAGGPMDIAGGGTLSGTCPERVATEMPVAGTGLTRTVILATVTVGTSTATEITLTVSGTLLTVPVVMKTLIPIS